MAVAFWVVLGATISLIAGFVAQAVRRARRGVVVVCPDTGELTRVRYDERRAVEALFVDTPQRVVQCERCPHGIGCERRCEPQIQP